MLALSCADAKRKSSSRDDDSTSVEPVPMSLAGAEFISKISGSVNQVSGAGDYDDLSDSDRSDESDAIDSTSDNFAEQILDTPARATEVARQNLVIINAIITQLSGTEGYFGTDDPRIRIDANGSGSNNFLLHDPDSASDDDAVFATLYVKPTFSSEDFAVDVFYNATESGVVERRLRLEFSKITGFPDDITATLSADWPLGGGVRQKIDAQYNTHEGLLSTTFGKTPASTSVPIATKVSLQIDSDGARATVLGAYRWHRDPVVYSSTTISPPRDYVTEDGDLEIFAGRYETMSNMELVQLSAFIPNTVAEADKFEYQSNYFSSRGHDTYIMKFLSDLVRTQGVNSTCSTSGNAFRTAFTNYGVAQTAAVAAAPANLCSTNTSYTNTQVGTVIEDTCLAGIQILLPVNYSDGTSENFALCNRWLDAYTLRNAQYFQKSGSTRGQKLPGETNSTHAEILSELTSVKFMDYSFLADPTWSDVEERPLSDFSGATINPK